MEIIIQEKNNGCLEVNNYNLHSKFDLDKHRQTFIHYLEVVIDENGKIMYAVPSHQEMMIKLACKKHNITREKLYDMCPEDYYFDFMPWLSQMSGACAVWENFTISHAYTQKQIDALRKLKSYGIYLGDIPSA